MADKQRSMAAKQPKDTKSITSMKAYKAVFGAVYDVDPESIEMLLWEETAFPMCDIRHATKQLVDYFESLEKG